MRDLKAISIIIYIKLVNKTKNTILTEDVYEAKNFKDRMLGLLDQSKPRSMVFSTRFGIHTFAMSEAIDILVLNDLGTVVKLKHSLPPNTFFFWKPRYQRVIELPAGSLISSGTVVGDVVAVEYQR